MSLGDEKLRILASSRSQVDARSSERKERRTFPLIESFIALGCARKFRIQMEIYISV